MVKHKQVLQYNQECQLSQLVAQTALDHYHKVLPLNKGKPQPGKEWTVYSAIVATKRNSRRSIIEENETCQRKSCIDDDDDDKNPSRIAEESNLAWVVSCATGMYTIFHKCQ